MATAHEVFADENRVILRKMSTEELAAIEADHQIRLAAKAAEDKLAADRAIAKAALLERLGITADEAALLLG